MDDRGNAFEASIMSDIFAGLIMGFVLSILSGVKAVHAAYFKGRYSWLKRTQETVLEYISSYHEFLCSSKMSKEDYYNKAYGTVCLANDINSRIMQGTFDNAKWIDPPK